MSDSQERRWQDRVARLEKRTRLLQERVERLRAERRVLEKAVKEHRRIFRELPGGVALVQQGKIVLVNERVPRYLGYDEAEMLGRPFLQFVHPEMAEAVKRIHEQRLAGKAVPSRYEIDLRTRNGERRCCEIRVRKMRHRGRRAFLVHLIDLTDHKARLRRMVETGKDEALGRMACGIRGELLQCLEGPEAETASARRRLLHRLELLAGAGTAATGSGERFDLRKILKEAAAEVRAVAGDGGLESNGAAVRLRTYLRAVAPVQGDPQRIRRAFLCLLENAVEALPGGGEIYLSSEERAGYAQVYIQDSGTGIPSGLEDKIFDPYFTTRGNGKDGLGLTLAQAIVRQHGGEIELLPGHNPGATFIIRLPVAPPPLPGKRPKRSIKGSRTLLVAEEGLIRDLLVKVFLSRGSRVSAASNAAEALRMMAKKPYDVVIVDADAPLIEEPRVRRKLGERTQNMVVVVLRSHTGMPDPDGLAVDLVVSRPVDVDGILAFVSEALSRLPEDS